MNRTLSALLLFGLSLGAQAPVKAPAQTSTEATAQVAAPKAESQPFKPGGASASDAEPSADKVLAHMGKRAIVYGDFIKWLKLTAGPSFDMVRSTKGSRDQAIKQYLDLQILDANARKLNLHKSLTFKQLMAAFEQQCLARVLLDESIQGSEGWKIKERAVNPTEEEMRAYFEQNKERYVTPERFTARHILVNRNASMKPGDTGLTEEEAKSRVAKIQLELKSGKTIEELAKTYSDDFSTKASGGLCQNIPFGRYAKEFDEAVRSQEIGRSGDPVKTSYGYHLIEVISRSPKQAAEFDKAKDAIRQHMIPGRRERMIQEFLDGAKKKVGFRVTAEGTTPADVKPAQAKAATKSSR